MDTMQKEQLSSIEGSDTGQIPLIQQCLTDRTVGPSGDPPDGLIQIPVGAEQVRTKVSDNGVLISGRYKFHDREPVADYVMITSCEHGTDLERGPATPAPAPSVDPPDPVHPEVGVQSELIAEPEHLMFTAGDHLTYADAGQVGRGQ
jgi:hypothetical protein